MSSIVSTETDVSSTGSFIVAARLHKISQLIIIQLRSHSITEGNGSIFYCEAVMTSTIATQTIIMLDIS